MHEIYPVKNHHIKFIICLLWNAQSAREQGLCSLDWLINFAYYFPLLSNFYGLRRLENLFFLIRIRFIHNIN